MTLSVWLLILGFVALVAAVARPVGMWMFALYDGRRTPLHAVLGPVERELYRIGGVDPARDQT